MDSLIMDIHNKFKSTRSLESFIPILAGYTGYDWRQYISENTTTYNRAVIPLPPNMTEFELIVITWMPGQYTPIHDHAMNGCVLRVLEGKLQECLYNKHIVVKNKSNLDTGTISYIDNSIGYHQINNISDKRSVSLHLYSPPKHNTNIFTDKNL